MKSYIYEVFGYSHLDNSPQALHHKKNCLCPFLGNLCDGGGNRYQTFLKRDSITDQEHLDFFAEGIKLIPPGVCSIKKNDEIWIVCPRRIFGVNTEDSHSQVRAQSMSLLREKFGLAGKKVGIWSEVKVKYSDASDEEDEKSFDYTFDYIVCEIAPVAITEVASRLGMKVEKVSADLIKLGYTLSQRNGSVHVEQYPVGAPNIIEIMTSSTSGGNKDKGTTIQHSFKKAVLGQEHESPSINYRQVWARMVSQLIVKSQIGHSWGAKTVWILQDSLTNYISKTTDLNLKKLLSTALREVNILSYKYSESRDENGCLELREYALYAGEIPTVKDDTDFNKLLQAASIPTVQDIRNRLIQKRARSFISL